MQALLVRDGRVSYERDFPKAEPGPGQALIRLLRAGICSTDIEIVKGYAAFEGILGHEFVGIVEYAADKSWVGQRVVGGINLGCRACPVCLSHGPEHCPQRTVLGIIGHNGAFADYLILPQENLLIVPNNVPDALAVFTEPLAAALRIREQIKVAPSIAAAVIGPGRLGLLIGQVLALAGTQVTMIGRRQESLDLPARLGLKTGLADDFPDNAYDLVVEATGNQAGLINSLRLVRPLGTLVLKSTFAGSTTLDLSKLVVAEINVVGSRCGPFEPALRLLAKQAIDVEAMIEAEYPLSEGISAFEHASSPGVRKVLLRP
jgi:threonine dehydrogenase-like Zn-dependent dehydrogenase